MDGMELPNQEKFRTLREKVTQIYLGILEPNTIKQEVRKEKIKKISVSGEPESYTKQNYIAEILSKE